MEHEDTLIWHHTRDGEFSVKSGYKVALSVDDVAECSNPQAANKWWKYLWNLKIPPKIRNFIWRLCKGWLPATSRLVGRGMDIDPSCFRCGYGRESIFHSIWQCPEAKKFWKATCFYGLFVPEDEMDMLGGLLRIQNILPRKDFCLFLTYIWQIWNMRNKALHKERCLLPDNLILFSECLLDDYLKYNEAGLPKRSVAAPPPCWSPSIKNCFQVNVDAAIDKSNGSCAAELLAIREGLVAAREGRFFPFSIASDCAVIVSSLTGGKKLFSDLGPLIEEVREWANCDSFAGFFHVSRLINGPAHKLARWAVSSSSSGGDLSSCPASISLTIAKDCIQL
ncbi:hypothetical protein UlMin_005591 [Ulmus minor]